MRRYRHIITRNVSQAEEEKRKLFFCVEELAKEEQKNTMRTTERQNSLDDMSSRMLHILCAPLSNGEKEFFLNNIMLPLLPYLEKIGWRLK
jgi:hypothetical protein